MRKTSNLDQAFIGTLWCENIIHKHSLWAEGGVWAVLYELGAGGCLVPRNPGRVGWGTTCSEPLRDFPVGRRH